MTNPVQPTTAKRVETVIGSIFAAAFLWLIWGWWSFTGLYRLVALMVLAIFDSYGVITTFILSYVGLAFVMLLTSFGCFARWDCLYRTSLFHQSQRGRKLRSKKKSKSG